MGKNRGGAISTGASKGTTNGSEEVEKIEKI
jgi:hypothetical protein